MKEATGELNLTVVVVLIVAGLVAFFSVFVRPMILGGIKSSANCDDAVCTKADCHDGVCNCKYYEIDPHTKRKSSTNFVNITCADRG